MYIYIYIHSIYIYIYAHMCVHIYIYIYIYTHRIHIVHIERLVTFTVLRMQTLCDARRSLCPLATSNVLLRSSFHQKCASKGMCRQGLCPCKGVYALSSYAGTYVALISMLEDMSRRRLRVLALCGGHSCKGVRVLDSQRRARYIHNVYVCVYIYIYIYIEVWGL